MVVAAGTAPDPRRFWGAVADILLDTHNVKRVAIEYCDRWGAGSVQTGAPQGDECLAETYREGNERYATVRITPPARDRASLQAQIVTAVELAGLVGHRGVLEHERRLGTFLVELSRWMKTVVADPQQLLQYTIHSVMSLTGAHGAIVVERAADGSLYVGAAVGETEVFKRDPADLRRSIFARVMTSEAPLLVERLADEPDAPVSPETRAKLAAAMLVPLPTSGDAAGVLGVFRVKGRQGGTERFRLRDLTYLQAVASHIGTALELTWAIRAARRAAQRASAMVNGSPTPLALISRAGQVIEANRALAILFGYEGPDRVRGQHLDAFPMTLDRVTALEALEFAASGVPWRGRAEVRRGSEERKCEAFFTQLDGSEGEAEFLLTMNDRTEELRNRRELVASEKLATVGTIAAGVAHEVNNPLAAIRMEAELLGIQVPAPEVAAASQAIIREVDRAARIAKSLLRLATQSHGRMELIGVGSVLQDIINVRAPLAREMGIELRITVQDDLPAVLARGGDLEQVFLNLITNAEDAVRGRAPGVIALTIERSEDGVRVLVDDSGPGVPRELRTRIFDPFFTTKPPDKGNGLGLAMVMRIMSELGGKIWGEDGPLGGARFIVELPTPIR
jgi:two-component system, NtrC family, sensor kinase